ncbi:hypothetical protein [Hyperthermus butylicus]|uniref:Uncharacterized protein n=1 Tax=Hyperthermus butylicus (strain DSM 5456 / JCM 9403 / PLM1-5) TaxID=415426 RepID=A2BL02_HYPBU|nr:hypothetical protein [Hyperthermus butylicus]ABM80663.1 hypothetical protein Hbut_0810 [Hyperthermus butylicus DSM 5456]
MAQSQAVRLLGYLLITLGVILFIYAFATGPSKGYLGSEERMTADTAAIIIGWFSLLIGPALAFGTAPASIGKRLQAER